MNNSVLLQMRSKYMSFNPAFKKVADFYLKSLSTEYIPITEVANSTGVSKATVSRFIQDMGYSSYKSFQMDLISAIHLNAESGNTEIFGYGDVHIDDSAEQIGRKVFLSNIKALEDTLEMVDFSVLEEICKQLDKKGNFYIFASGRSIVAAESISKRLTRLGILSIAQNDPHEQALFSTMTKPGDLVVGISAFGRSSSVLRAMERSKKNGAMVVGLTSHRGTPIENVSTHMLYTVTSDPIFHSAEPSCTTITHIVTFDCLYMMLVMKNLHSVHKMLLEGADAMENERFRQ